MIENHCVSLDLAKKLKEAEWKKETKFWWSWLQDTNFNNHVIIVSEKFNDWYGDVASKICLSAPLATEILEELPIACSIWCDGVFTITAENHKTTDLHLPNALAKMYLYLKQEKLI